MTSWTRGKENEERGERELHDNDASDNLKGISDKVGGELEQGVNNVGDTLSGKQHDLEGHERTGRDMDMDNDNDMDADDLNRSPM